MNGTEADASQVTAYCPFPVVLNGPPAGEGEYPIGVAYRFASSIANNVYTTGAILSGLDPRSTFT